MPAAPGACFVVVHTEFALGFLKGTFHRPTHAGHIDQPRLGYVGRGITEIDLEFGTWTEGASKDHPNTIAGSSSALTGGAHKGKVGFNRSLTAILDGAAPPFAT